MASQLLLPRKQMDNKTVLDSIKRNIVHRVSLSVFLIIYC